MSRATRTARGTAGALIATLFAAASHALGGGEAAPFAMLVAGVLALPVCVALAGRLGSLWRLGLAVTASQLLYHWCFSVLGAAAGTAGTAGAAAGTANPHLAHLGGLAFAPSAVADAGTAGTAMWVAHAAAAILTIALLHRGERAALGLARLIGRALPFALPRAVSAPERAAIRPAAAPARSRVSLAILSAISHRGPPRSLAPTT